MTKINGFQRVSVQTDRRNEIARSILVKEQLGLGLGLDDRKNLTLPNWLPSGIYRIMTWEGKGACICELGAVHMQNFCCVFALYAKNISCIRAYTSAFRSCIRDIYIVYIYVPPPFRFKEAEGGDRYVRRCPLHVRYMSATCPLHIRYMSVTCPLRVRYVSATCPLRVRYDVRYGVCTVSVRCSFVMSFTCPCMSVHVRTCPCDVCETKLLVSTIRHHHRAPAVPPPPPPRPGVKPTSPLGLS